MLFVELDLYVLYVKLLVSSTYDELCPHLDTHLISQRFISFYSNILHNSATS